MGDNPQQKPANRENLVNARSLISPAIFLALAFPSTTVADNPEASSSVSVYTAKREIRQLVREREPTLARGSLYVGNCRHGYSRQGRHRVLCDVYFEKTDAYTGRCGWGRVVTYRTFWRVEYDTRGC